MSKRINKIFQRAHVLLILLICITLSIAIFILNAPQKTGSSVARQTFNTCNSGGVAVTSFACTINSVPNGHTLIATITTSGTTTSRVSSITQSGATWTRAAQAANASIPTVEIWYTTSTVSVSTSLTIAVASVRASAVITQYSGLLTSSLLDKTTGTSGSSTAPSTGTTTTTAQANQLWVGALAISRGGANLFATPTNSFVEISESASGATTSDVSVSYLERIVTATGTASTSQTTVTDTWAGAIATFNATGPPTQIAFTTSSPSLTAGVCSNAITFETRDSSGTPVYATNGVVIQVIGTTSNAIPQLYTDASCSSATTTTFTFNGLESSKTFYMKDTYANASSLLEASKLSGSDTLTGASLTYSVSPGSISKLGIRMPGQTTPYSGGKATGTPTAQTAGASFTITEIRALDAYDNTATSYSGAKTITYSGPGNAPNGTTPSYTTSVSFSNGVSTTTLTTILYNAETGITLTATEGGSYGSATNSFTVNPAVLNDYGMQLSSTSVIAGSCAANTLSITARDVYQNIRTNDTSTVNMTTDTVGMQFYLSSDCSISDSSFTLSAGTVMIYWRPTKKASGVTITATKNLDTPTGTSASITVDPAAVSTLLVKLPGQSFTDGSGISGGSSFTGLRTPNATAGTSYDVVVYAVDTYNNLVDSGTNNYTGAKTLSWSNSTAGNAPSGTAPSYPATSVTFSNGTSTTTLTATYYNATTGRNIRADDSGTPVTGTASTSFVVQANSANNYGVSAPTPQTAGVAFNVTVTARDAYNNALGSLYSAPSGAYTWSTTAGSAPDGTGANIGSLVQNDFSGGAVIKSVTLHKAESSITFTAGEPSPSGVVGTSSSININPGYISANSSDSTVTGNSQGYAGYSEMVTITLKDTWRNPISNINKSNIVVSATGSPYITQPASNTDVNGVTTAYLTWNNTGSHTVSITITNDTLVQNDGSTPDSDGKLDSTLSITISPPIPSSILRGDTIIRGGTIIR